MNDLEELKVINSEIYSLGKKTFNLDDIDGRFLGITKFSKKSIKNLKKKIIPNILKKNRKIDFTNFLMELVRRDLSVNAVCGKFSWHEFDTMKDFKNFEKL